MSAINIVTIILVIVLVIPLIYGAYKHFTREKVFYSISSVLENIMLILGLILSVYLVRKIYFDHESGFFKGVYDIIPKAVKSAFYGRDVFVYIINVPLLLLIYLALIRIVTKPLYKHAIIPFSDWIYTKVSSMGNVGRKILGVISQIPKSIFILFISVLLLNFYNYYNPSQTLSRWINESPLYQVVYKNAISPVLNSNIAKQIPIVLNDTFRKQRTQGVSNPDPIYGKGNPFVIQYFNGVTLDEAIKSNSEIDNAAKKIVGNEKDGRKKAKLIYTWITKNITYDYEKVEMVNKEVPGVQSGSIIAYDTRKGICFDFSSLYISMCRAVGLKVRMITGLGYNGVVWGDHAWNQVYYSEGGRWINIDTTFGVNANYFDKPDFNVDHKDAEIQGEW